MAMQFVTPMVEVGLVTNNLAQMLHYYRDVLGLPYREKLEYPGGMQERLNCGDSVIKLVTWEQPPAQRSPGGPANAATGIRYISFSVANIRQVVADVRAAGFEATDVGEFQPGLGFAFLVDPDGNQIELYGPV
jgi:catechol 2,3-dioxygenase-like lactoylglutathione lyase family enzyme